MSDAMLTDADMAELREAYFAQAGEIIDNLSGYIMAVEKDPSEASWRTLKRAFHTLKGDSRAMGFTGVSSVAHRVEDLIETLTGREPERASTDLLLGCADALGAFMDTLAGGGDPDTAPILARIEAHLRSGGAPAGAQETAGGGHAGRAALLKIEPERVDRIMNLVGELVIGRSVLSQMSAEVHGLRRETIAARLYSLNASFERTLAELQRSVMKVRMLPIEVVFRRFPRVVRDLSAERGKAVRLETAGETTELDKAVVDVIAEPLMHMVRNAIDHGIETPGERRAAGKPEEGRIRLGAFHQGTQIVIEVSDDGRGIDTGALTRKALGQGIIGAEEAGRLGAGEAAALIFHPGLSTARGVTEVSGRGVGMNIVKEVVESLRGVIDISTERGGGTKFTIRLPLTLAIIKSILFACRSERYALPLACVNEIVRVVPADIRTMGGSPVFRHRDRMVPLISLDGDGPPGGKSFILFFGVGHLRAGIMAERIMGEEELVSKALDGQASGGIASGASVLGDGSVVLILDPLSLIRKHLSRREDAAVHAGADHGGRV